MTPGAAYTERTRRKPAPRPRPMTEDELQEVFSVLGMQLTLDNPEPDETRNQRLARLLKAKADDPAATAPERKAFLVKAQKLLDTDPQI